MYAWMKGGAVILFYTQGDALVAGTEQDLLQFLLMHKGWRRIERSEAEGFPQLGTALMHFGAPVDREGSFVIATKTSDVIPLSAAKCRLQRRGEVFDYPWWVVPTLAQRWNDCAETFPFATRYKTERCRRTAPDGMKGIPDGWVPVWGKDHCWHFVWRGNST